MFLRRVSVLLVFAGLALLVAGGAGAQTEDATVPSIELSGSIDPATEKWIGSALDDAADDDAPLAIIRIDTPGGLEESMRGIVQDIIEAPMPVVVYVAPNGARAASAGAFITEAADVAAMAPQTNIGSASAVTSTGEDIGGTLGEKIDNDAAAFIRALAETHGRDGDPAGTDGHRGGERDRGRGAGRRRDRPHRGQRGRAARASSTASGWRARRRPRSRPPGSSSTTATCRSSTSCCSCW